MYQKNIEEPLTFYECVQLLDTCAKNEIIQRDPDRKNNILLYREAGRLPEYPEGWYSENLMSVASELAENVNGQRLLRQTLEEKGVELSFSPLPNFNFDCKKEKEQKELEM